MCTAPPSPVPLSLLRFGAKISDPQIFRSSQRTRGYSRLPGFAHLPFFSPLPSSPCIYLNRPSTSSSSSTFSTPSLPSSLSLTYLFVLTKQTHRFGGPSVTDEHSCVKKHTRTRGANTAHRDNTESHTCRGKERIINILSILCFLEYWPR